MSHPLLLRRALWRVFYLISLVGLMAAGNALRAELAVATPSPAPAAKFHLWSNDLKDGGSLPEAHVLNDFGRHGGNLSPQLAWAGAPAGTKSFVVTVFDPDAPTGSGWWHWVVVDLPTAVHELTRGAGSAGQLPEGARQTRTDFGRPGYGGAAPPAGEVHHYVFTVHALKVDKLPVDADASAAMVGFMVHMNSLGHASLTVTYGP